MNYRFLLLLVRLALPNARYVNGNAARRCQQVMDFLPWKTFHRIVDRYGGDHRTRSLSCAEQFRVMAFAQLTYRESPHN